MRLLFVASVASVLMFEAHAAPARPSPARPARALQDLDEAADADPPALADAVAAYEGNKPQTASFALHEMLQEGRFPAKEGKIQYFLALSLSDLGMDRAAGHYLVEVVKRGPSDPYFALALPRLASIAARTGDDAELARLAARIAPEDVPAAARDAMAYLRGVRLLDAGDLSAARAELAEVADTSSYHPRARYLTGVILNQQERLRSAADTFREVSQARPTDASAEDARVHDLAVLDLGRIHYGIGRYDTADAWYAEVPRRSVYWPQSVFESAWANFQQADPDRTLGQLLTLHAPSLAEDEFLPEAEILATLTFFTLCDYDEVERGVDAFDARYRPMHAELTAFVGDYASADAKKRAGEAYDRYFGPDPAATVLPKSLFARALRDRELAGVVTQLDALAHEEALVNAQKRVWRDTVGEDLSGVLAADRERLLRRGGLALLRELATTAASLGDLLEQAQIIRFERADALLSVYTQRLASVDPLALAPQDRGDIAYSVSTDRVYWPFNGEFWDDELGSYRYAEASACR